MNKDVLNLLLVSSDPLISSLRKLPKKATKTDLSEALKLFAVSKESEDLLIFTLLPHTVILMH
jgi:hypothetical protein